MCKGGKSGGLRSLSGLGVLEPSSPIPVLVLYPRRTTARTTLPPSGVPYMPQNNRQIHVTSFVLYYIGGNRRRELITSPPHRGRLILANKDVTPVSSLWSLEASLPRHHIRLILVACADEFMWNTGRKFVTEIL